ncbi:MAG TPA: HAD family hydrolase, partial [Spirochaetia bacterium]
MAHTAVLFDLDGTLLDTIEDLGDSMNAVLTRLGYPTHDMAAYKLFVGDGVTNLVRRAVPEEVRRNEEAVQRIVPQMRDEYAKRLWDKTHAYEGIAELLAELRARGVKMAVLSNKPHPATVEVIGHYFPAGTFDTVLGARPGVPIKPDPGAVREVCRLLGKGPEDFLYLGDTNTDMKTARAAGMFAVGVLWGFRTE